VPIVAPGVEISDEHRALAGLYSPINSRQEVAYFLERVFDIQKIWFEEGKMMRQALLGGEPSAYLPVSPTLFKSGETGVSTLSYVVDPLVGPVVHSGMSVLKPASKLLVYGQLGIAVLWGLSIILSIVFLLIWGVRRLRGKIAPGPAIRIRLWPLFAGLSVIVFVWMFALGIEDPFTKLAAPTFISLTIMLATIAFADNRVRCVHVCGNSRCSDLSKRRNESRYLLGFNYFVGDSTGGRSVSPVLRRDRNNDMGIA